MAIFMKSRISGLCKNPDLIESARIVQDFLIESIRKVQGVLDSYEMTDGQKKSCTHLIFHQITYLRDRPRVLGAIAIGAR